MRVLLFLAAASSLGAQPLDWRPIMRASLERMVESDARMADYAFDRQVVKKEFEPDGRLKLQTTTLMRPERVEGVWISRIITLDGKPLTDVEKRRQEEAIRRRINEEKGQQSRPPSILGRENDELIRLFPEALEYRLLGEELKDGRKTWVLACQPRPGYKPPNLRARFFEKVRGKVWVDQANKDLVRVDAEVFDTISVGFGLLGRVEKGTRFVLNRARVSEGHYFTESSQVNFTAKVLIFKTLINEISTQYSNFKLRTAVEPKR
jgi:hypothetical protein